MKVWRGFTLTFWTILLTFCFIVILFYYALNGSVLNARIAKQHLASSSAYDTFRDTVVTDQVAQAFADRYPSNTLIDHSLLQSTLAETFPKKELQKELEPTIDSLYAWLDSKTPEPTFAVPLANKQEQFYRSLEVQLSNKIASLPRCTTYSYPPVDALVRQGCLPSYLTADEATAGIMDAIKADGTLFTPASNTDVFTLPLGDNPQVRAIPTYLNYLWTLHYVALAVAAIVAVFVLISRRLIGLLAIGVAALLASVSGLVGESALRHQLSNPHNTVVATLQSVFLPPFTDLLQHYALGGLAAGLVVVLATSAWLWRQRRRRA